MEKPYTGKLPPDLLERHVLGRRGTMRPEVLVPASFGEDAAVLDLGDRVCVASVDPITGSGTDVGWMSVHVSCNDVASHGAEPVAVLLCVMVPPEGGLEAVKAIMAGAERAATQVGVQIAGGHTEMTPGLPQPIVTATVLGAAPRDRYITSSGLRPGHSLVMTKSAGLEGVAILAWDYGQLLSGKIGGALVDRARGLGQGISVVTEALAAARSGATAMHDATEGGVLGAVWEMAGAAGTGLEIHADRIPVDEATRAVCAALGADPLRLISSGVLLIGVAAAEEEALLAALSTAGVPGTVIGTALEPEAGRWLVTAGARRPLDPPESDELWRVKEELD